MPPRSVVGSVEFMESTALCSPDQADAVEQPGPVVRGIGVSMVVWCVGFAAVNVVFEVTDHFAGGPYARYASGLSVVDWFVVALKVLGAIVALLSIARRPRFVSPAVVTVLVWGAFATLAVYVLGSMAEAVAIVSGLAGSADQITVASVGYVLFFLVAAAGYGVLAFAYLRRHGQRKVLAGLGLLGAPAVLGLVLLVIPAILTATGLMPTS
jgi:hypothetical protein